MGATERQYHLEEYVFIALNCSTWDSIDVFLLSWISNEQNDQYGSHSHRLS